MQTLAGIDTTKVYHKFGFNCDQVKDLKLKQYFIHSDVVNWFEEILANQYRELNIIKIIYKRLYHFDINHVTCVEFYHGENDLETFQDFTTEMDDLIDEAQYKMSWRSDTIYYVHSGQTDLLTFIEEKLKNQNLQNLLVRRYKMEVEWCTTHSLTFYEFTPNLNKNQLNRLDNIFQQQYIQPIFISEEFMFLKISEPPSNFYSYILTVFRHKLLSGLSIEDILSLELANKDYRFEWYNSVLDRDVQIHLRNRLNLINEQTKFQTYDASDFTNVRLLKYFLYKYRDCFTTVDLPIHIFTDDDFDVIVDENQSLKFSSLSNSAIRFDIISSENVTVCSITLQRHTSGKIFQPHLTKIMEIRLDSHSDIRSILDADVLFPTTCRPTFIEIAIRANCKSIRLTNFFHTVLEKIHHFDFNSDSIIQLKSYNNLINSCIMDSFVQRVYKFEINFKNIIFDFKCLVKWLSKCSSLTNVSLTDCTLQLNDKHSNVKILEMMAYQNPINHLTLTFRNMKFDIPTISTLLNIRRGNIVYDGCCLTPSASVLIPPKSFKTIGFENMNIDLQVLLPLLPHVSVEFDSCQISSNHDPILQIDSTAESSRDNRASFSNMDIDLEVLLNISVCTKDMDLNRCRILSNEMVNISTNYPTNETKASDLSITKIPVKCNSILQLLNMSITPEFIKGLKYLNFYNDIQFYFCEITNQNLSEIWAAAPRCQRISITTPHLLDYYFYFELIAKMYENRIGEMVHELQDGVAIPLLDLFKIDWSTDTSNNRDMDWPNMKIRSVLVNDVTVKLEYLKNGDVVDLFFERNNLLNDSDECEVNYY